MITEQGESKEMRTLYSIAPVHYIPDNSRGELIAAGGRTVFKIEGEPFVPDIFLGTSPPVPHMYVSGPRVCSSHVVRIG